MKRSILVLGVLLMLAVLGGTFFALRPAFASDSMEDLSNPQKTTLVPTDEREFSGLLSFEYDWDLSAPPNHTLLMSNASPDIFADLQPAVWKISCHMQNGQYKLNATPPQLHAKDATCQVRSRFIAEFGPNYIQRHPDGTQHPIRSIKLICELWIYRPFFQKPLQAFAFQELRLDLIDGSADVSPPISHLLTAKGMQHRIVSDTMDAPLPSRHCGTEREKAFSRLLFLLASVDSRPFAEICTKEALKQSEKLLTLQSAPNAPWPDCWGEDAPLARKTAQRIVPTLLRLQENGCYEYQPLADFINGDAFGRIFGSDFSSIQAPLSDMPPIRFERVDEKK